MIEDDDGTTQGNAIDVVRQEITALKIEPGYRIAGAIEAVGANDALGKIKGLNKRIAEAKAAEVEPLNAQIKAVRERYRDAEALLLNAEDTLKRAILLFRKEEQARLEAQRIADETAAAKERARLESEARKEREKAEARAAALRAKGQDEKADAAIQVAETSASAKEAVAAMVAAPVGAAEPTKLTGSSVRELWKGKITDLSAFLAAIAGSDYDIEDVVQINQAGLNRLAKTLKGNMSKVLPGSVAIREESLSARAV
jgi:hypothetical protein